MKFLLLVFGSNLVALACIGIAGYLASQGKEGWGWFLIVALCVAVTFSKED